MNAHPLLRLGFSASLLWVVMSVAISESQPPRILRFVEGIDSEPIPMRDEEVAAELNDRWATIVLRKGTFPATVADALQALDQFNTTPDGVPDQDSYFVSEAAHIPVGPSSARLKREFRMVVTRGASDDALPVLLLSAPAGDREGFIELMSWDPTKTAFNFYRRPANGPWMWKGDTRDAFKAGTRGNGCFMCHVHGTPVMKELRLPWNNWHSERATIPREAIPDGPIRDGPLFTNKSEAQLLEKVVRGWTAEAMAARMADAMKGDTLANAPSWLRPLFETTTVNLISSGVESNTTNPTLSLPTQFFLNVDALNGVLGLDLPPNFTNPVMKREMYRQMLTTFNFRLEDGAFTQPGDTHFAFVVPEPAIEDTQAIRELVNQKVVTRHFAMCVLLVDFSNAIFSGPRSHLLRYVPTSGHIQDGRSDAADRTALAIVRAAATKPAESPENEFKACWEMSPDHLKSEAEKRVKRYLAAVQKRLRTQAGLEDYTRLAGSRRDEFAKMPLREAFPLLLPKTNLPPATWRMNPDGTVTP